MVLNPSLFYSTKSPIAFPSPIDLKHECKIVLSSPFIQQQLQPFPFYSSVLLLALNSQGLYSIVLRSLSITLFVVTIIQCTTKVRIHLSLHICFLQPLEHWMNESQTTVSSIKVMEQIPPFGFGPWVQLHPILHNYQSDNHDDKSL